MWKDTSLSFNPKYHPQQQMPFLSHFLLLPFLIKLPAGGKICFINSPKLTNVKLLLDLGLPLFSSLHFLIHTHCFSTPLLSGVSRAASAPLLYLVRSASFFAGLCGMLKQSEHVLISRAHTFFYLLHFFSRLTSDVTGYTAWFLG